MKIIKWLLPSCLLFYCLLFQTQGQTWISQGSGFSTPYLAIKNFSVVSSQVVWASAFDGSSNSAIQRFTRTTNGGTNWTAGIVNNTSGLQISMITAVDANTAWVAMYYVNGSSAQGIYKTTNGGSTWTQQTTATYYDPLSFPDVVYFWNATSGVCIGDPTSMGDFEIYTTTNGGTNWVLVPGNQIPDPLSGEYGLVADYAVSGNSIWFGTNKGRIYRSTDNGLHWNVAPVPTMSGKFIMPAFRNASNGLAKVIGSSDTTNTLASTSNGGSTFASFIHTGECFMDEIKYLPGTANTYSCAGYTNGVPQEMIGLSWTYDGGLHWQTDQTFFNWGTQITATGWVDANTGWAGTFNSSASDGIYKMTQGGTQGTPPVAHFTTADTSVFVGDQVHLTDQSTGNPTTWVWTLPGTVQQSSALQNPVITYNYAGFYDITLYVTNAFGQSTLVKQNYIHVYEIPHPPPQNLHVTVVGNVAHATWEPPAGAYQPDGYNVYLSGMLWTPTPTTNLFFNSPALSEGKWFLTVKPVYGSIEYPGPSGLALVGTVTLDMGWSKYDLQTNGSVQERFYLYEDGQMGAAWTNGATPPDYPDRGTGYNYQNGMGWDVGLVDRIESVRTGWPSYQPWGSDGEIVIAHESTPSLVMSTRTTKGSGLWSQNYISPPSGVTTLNWPRMITSGPDHNNIHMIVVTQDYYQGLNGALLYYRSLDGGTTWDKAGEILPQLTSADYQGFSGDNYAWGSPHGDTLVFAAGGQWSDTFIMVSTDNGNTWNKTTILSNANIWHVNNTYTAPFYSSDGSLSVEMDHQGRFHVVFGRMQVADDGNYGTSYFPGTDGLVYWNSSMPMLNDSLNLDTLQSKGQLMGFVPGDASGDTIVGAPNYKVSLSSFPQITIDNQDRVYVVWSGLSVGNPYYGNLGYVNYRHLRGRASYDQGSTWTDMIDLSTGTMDAGKEFVYPCMAKNSDGSIHILYQNADIPGSAEADYQVSTHSVGFSHRSIPKTTFPNTAPVTTIPGMQACFNSSIRVPVIVTRFHHILSFSLRIEYDPAVMTFNATSSSVNTVLTGAIINNQPVGGNSSFNKLMITWTGASPENISDGDTLAFLGFNYLSGTSSLKFNQVINAHDCEYTDENGTPIYDIPAASFYKNGSVTPCTPKTWTGLAGDDWNNPLSWSPPGVPFISDDVVIPGNASFIPVVRSQGFGCHNMTISNNANLIVNSGITLTVTGKCSIQ